MITKINLKKTSGAVIIAMFVTACGGGGGGSGASTAATSSGSSSTTTTTTPPTVTPPNLQTTVPAFTYAAASQEFAFATALNSFRQSLGLGLLSQNTTLDLASSNHLAYILVNDINNGGTVDFSQIDPATGLPLLHVENPSLPKFTGVLYGDRTKAAGYTGIYTAEEVGFGGGQGGVAALDTLIQTVYHRAGLMFQGVREIGVAVGTDKSQTVVMEMGYQTAQAVGSDYVGVYPSSGQTGIALHAYVESPNPFPDLSTANTDFPTKTSYPISVSIAEGRTILVTSFTVTQAGQTAPLSTRQLTKSNDTNNELGTNVAFLIGNAPFLSGTTYNVSFSGTNNGTAFTKQWSFTTQ